MANSRYRGELRIASIALRNSAVMRMITGSLRHRDIRIQHLAFATESMHIAAIK